ncbi:MAG: hypothetical protein J1E31_06295 [Helicobacter sp.]|nr:hypothetical protein [Helicobacter sp.]
MKEVEIFKEIDLNEAKGKMKFAIIKEPYGAESKPVVSISVNLEDKEEAWKVHIPLSQVKEVRSILKEIRADYKQHKKEKKQECEQKSKKVKKRSQNEAKN